MNPRETYPHFQTVPTRWKDNDRYGHVNNVEYYSYFDSVVNCYLIDHGGLDIHDGTVIGYIAESHCKYLQGVAYPDVLEIGLRVGKLGNSSVRYELGLFRQGSDTLCAEGWMVHVFVDRGSNRPHPIPDGIRAALARLQITAST
jgi:acyl-CoA thioester hydrolase